MEAGGKDCEEETLQTAFKKLRVDAESVSGPVSVSEVLALRATPRPCLDSSGAKPKLGCSKDNWHGCTRKTSRGASRTQRRRRSKSPILHPPKFTYCNAAAASTLSPSSGSLKQQRLAVPEPVEPCPVLESKPEQKELSSSGSPGHISPLVFGSCTGYESRVGAEVSSTTSQEVPSVVTTATAQEGGNTGESSEEEKGACDGATSRAGALLRPGPAEAADFSALSKLHSAADVPCSCSCPSDSPEESGQAAETPCSCQLQPQGWNSVEVYSFTGLRDVITECERIQATPDGAARTLSSNSSTVAAAAAGSPRSCSEQARVYVDDITIEDLSGYMEYYLYIPKMSHMTEMMYT